MAKNKKIKQCFSCGSSEALYITLKNGENLPSFAIDLGSGVIRCHPCHKSRLNFNAGLAVGGK